MPLLFYEVCVCVCVVIEVGFTEGRYTVVEGEIGEVCMVIRENGVILPPNGHVNVMFFTQSSVLTGEGVRV